MSNNADIFLQWKGTDACFDFHCPCGTSQHIDATFSYYVKCVGCETIYQMPYDLTATPIAPDDPDFSGDYVTGQTIDE